MGPSVAQLPAARRRFAYFLDDVARPPRACVEADDELEADGIARADPLVAFGFTLDRLREILRAW